MDERLAKIRSGLKAARLKMSKGANVLLDDMEWLVEHVEKLRQLRDMIARESCCNEAQDELERKRRESEALYG